MEMNLFMHRFIFSCKKRESTEVKCFVDLKSFRHFKSMVDLCLTMTFAEIDPIRFDYRMK